MNDAYDIIENIRLTEKGHPPFRAAQPVRLPRQAARQQAPDQGAIEKLFGKTVLSVNTSNYAGKKKRERTANYGRKPHWKKAIVTLKEGDKIDLA